MSKDNEIVFVANYECPTCGRDLVGFLLTDETGRKAAPEEKEQFENLLEAEHKKVCSGKREVETYRPRQ